MKIKSNIQTIIPRIVLPLFGFAFILTLICPAVERADAADPISNGANAAIAVTTKPAISVTLSSGFDMEVQPDSLSGTFTKHTSSLTVATNNATGYKAYLYTSNGKSTLDPKNPNNTAVVNAVTAASTEANFPANSWGYSLDKAAVSADTTYTAMPTANDDSAMVIETTGANANDTYNFTIGASVDLTLPSDSYGNEVVLSVVANPKLIVSLSDATYMQEMTADICANSDLNETKQLVDSRDNKMYWVAKLADDKCWMTQNLDLDLNASTLPLTVEDSDVAADWTMDAAYYTTTTISSQSDATTTYSWDVGKLVLKQPNLVSANTEAYCVNTTTLDNCAYVVDVSGMTGDYISTQTGDTDYSWYAISENGTGTSYDAHYELGNYYQWPAATVGTGANIINITDATSSICPKGWRLPLMSSTNDYDVLMSAAGISSEAGVGATLSAQPIYLYRNGYINSGSITGVGSRGNYWTGAGAMAGMLAVNRISATQFSFSNDAFYITGSGSNSSMTSRYTGVAVRCIAR